MSKTEKTTKPESARARRPNVPIGSAAHAEMQLVSEAFNIPFRVVRQTAGEVASEAILAYLRNRLGADRLKAAKAEFERLQREMGEPVTNPEDLTE